MHVELGRNPITPAQSAGTKPTSLLGFYSEIRVTPAVKSVQGPLSLLQFARV